MTKILHLTSSETAVWHSMTEILPLIQAAWMEAASRNNHLLTLIEVSENNQKEVCLESIDADIILIDTFSIPLMRVFFHIRRDINPKARLIFYLHGMAPMICWPLLHWGPIELIRDSDLFIGTCDGDLRSLKQTFDYFSFKKVPFTYLQESKETKKLKTVEKLIYTGRISEQKNLHTLFWALSLLKKENISFSLDIYGEEDFMGSPLMGKKSSQYLFFLKELRTKLSLESHINFKGLLKREDLFQTLEKTPHCFISPSLHYDENFGMSAYLSLSMGQKAILSDWGGHQELSLMFPKQVKLAQTYSSPQGPYLDSKDLAEKIKDTLLTEEEELPYQDHFCTVKLIEDIIKTPIKEGLPLKLSPLATKLLEKRSFYQEKENQKQKIFSSYEDSNYLRSSKAYLGKVQKRQKLIDKKAPHLLAPWVAENQNFFIIKDPHKGEIRIKKSENSMDELYQRGYLIV